MINGWVIVDKPEGVSSAQVVSKIKRLFKVKKVGHGGTLDPLATGVLPIALGEATKTVSYVLEGTKSYRFALKWGEARTTDDQEGEITTTSEKRPSLQDIETILPSFHGSIQQIPPSYSALKVKGKRAYALAREGKKVELAPRQITISTLTLLTSTPETATFEVVCSKGTYIRSLARDLAVKLGTYAHIIRLRRLKAGPFDEKDAILLDSLLKIGHNTELMPYVMPLESALADILALKVAPIDAVKLRQGQSLSISQQGKEGVALILCKNIPQALAQIKGGKIIPLRVFNIENDRS